MAVRVVTDSVASVPTSDAEELGIDVVSLFVNDGDTTVADLDLDPDAFYRRLGDMEHLPTSSQPSVESFLDVFRSAAEAGAEVLGVFISEKMSGTLQTARLAAGMAQEQFAGLRIELVDSRSNSMEEGLAAEAAARAAQAGETLETCRQAALETIERTRYLFTPETLEYLRRGGRIGGASALLGGLLQIKPILTVHDGETNVFAKVRTRKKALAEMARIFAVDVREYGLREVIVHYIGERATAEAFAVDFVEPVVKRKVRIIPVSPVIGVHVGPAIGIVYETERALAS